MCSSFSRAFQSLLDKQLPPLNQQLKSRNLPELDPAAQVSEAELQRAFSPYLRLEPAAAEEKD